MSVVLNDGDLVEGRVVCYMGAQIGVNVYHWVVQNKVVVGAPINTVDAATILDLNYFHANYKPALSQDANYYGVGVRRVTPNPSLEDGIAVNQAAGTDANPALPGQISGLIGVITALAGRANRGRKYIPFPSVNSSLSGRPTVAYKALLTTIGSIYSAVATVTNGTGSSVELLPVVKHRNDTYIASVSGLARNDFGTQRSRGNYGRPNALPIW